jgi:hypothetical protein
VRVLKARAAYPGSVRVTRDNGVIPGVTGGPTQVIGELLLDPGRWILTALGTFLVRGNVLTGAEWARIDLRVEIDGVETIPMIEHIGFLYQPNAIRSASNWAAVPWHIDADVLSEDQPIRAKHVVATGDHSGSVHAVEWNRSQLMAIPV